MVHTKKIIKDTFWELLEEKPYNKITVQDIVDRCQVNRNTFYYHFENIPMLMLDSIDDWTSDVIQKYGSLESPVNCLIYIAEECMGRKKAFLHLFRSVEKGLFLSGLNKRVENIIHAYIDKTGMYTNLLKNEKDKIVKCYKCVFTGSVLEWLEEGCSYNLAEFFEDMYKIFPGPVNVS